MSGQVQDALPRKVLLTGASRGIGAAIARALAAEGVRLALVGRDRDALRAVAASCEAHARRQPDGPHAVIVADLTAVQDAAALADRGADALAGLDGFVACAGVVDYASIGAISEASLSRQLAVNFTSPFLIAQRAAEHIAQRGGGAMLFVASTLAIRPAPLSAAYAASKAALISAARSFALELGPRSIRVNALAPGVVETDMVRVVRPRPAAGSTGPAPARSDAAVEERIAAQLEELRALHPLGRLGRPEEVAETALYLLRTPFVSGTVVRVDGGLTLGSGRP